VSFSPPATSTSPFASSVKVWLSHATLQKFLGKPEVREQVNIQREELAGMFDSVAHSFRYRSNPAPWPLIDACCGPP
jgi:hypothetical protein